MRLIDAEQFDIISLQGKSKDFVEGVEFMLNKIDHAPTIKYGHWEDSSNGWMCSECKTDHMTDTKYCPNCGARMNNGIKEGDTE